MTAAAAPLLECVVNISEGTDTRLVAEMASVSGPSLLDVHSDADHNRSVFTLAGPAPAVEDAARALTAAAVRLLDLAAHQGAHPRLGVVDVVPFVALEGWPVADGDLAGAAAARDRFAGWASRELGLPCFLYGPERSLPEVRRRAWKDLRPETGERVAHPTAGAACVGVRPVLVAYNLWLAGGDLAQARRIAAELRRPGLRTLGLRVGKEVQVSCNLVDPWRLGPGEVHDLVAARAPVARAELVGLLPAGVLAAEPRQRWSSLGLSEDHTIEARLIQAGLDGGRLGG